MIQLLIPIQSVFKQNSNVLIRQDVCPLFAGHIYLICKLLWLFKIRAQKKKKNPQKRESWRWTCNVGKQTQRIFILWDYRNWQRLQRYHSSLEQNTVFVNWFNLGWARDALFVLHKKLQTFAPVRKHFVFLWEDKLMLLFNHCRIWNANLKVHPGFKGIWNHKSHALGG